MILKVKVVHANVAVNQEVIQSWRFFEDVQGLHYTVYQSGAHLMQERGTWGTPEDVQTIDYTAIRPADTPMMLATFHSDSMGAVHLFCDTECYLLNGNGKTVERLI